MRKKNRLLKEQERGYAADHRGKKKKVNKRVFKKWRREGWDGKPPSKARQRHVLI